MRVILEAGINHNGSMEAAQKLIDLAYDTGCPYVKFQFYDTARLFTPEFPFYHDSERSMLTAEQLSTLFLYASSKEVIPFASVFHPDYVPITEHLRIPIYKVASCSVRHQELLEAIAETGKPVILSTGNQKDDAVDRALSILSRNRVTLLYCVPKYPARFSDFNFSEVFRMEDRFHREVGLSDHSPDLRAARAALSMGLPYLEHHVTLSRTDYPNCDATASWEPDQLRDFMTEVKEWKSAQSAKKT